MYFAVVAYCFALNFIPKRPFKKICFQISFIILFIFAALRYEFGNDYISYHNYFNAVKAGITRLEIEEIGYKLLNMIFPSFYLMVAVFSGLFLYFIYKLVINYLELDEYKYALLIFLIDPYLYLMSLSMIRQSMAILLFGIAIRFSKEKKYLIYIALCFLAASIHTSAIILIPFLFVANTNRDIITKPKWVIAIAVLLFIFSATLLTPIIELILKAFNDPNYLFYYKTVSTNTLRATILSSVPFLYVCLNVGKLNDDKLMYTKLSMFAYFTEVFAYQYAMLERFGYYFSYFKIIALPSIFIYNYHNSRGRERIINVWIFPVLILIIYILRLYSFFSNPMWKSFTVYRTIFDLL